MIGTPNGVRYWALGRAWTLLGSRKNSKPEKYLKMATNPQRPVVGSRDGAWDFSPGFHPLPHRTVHEVFPHTAHRQPSSWSIQAIHCHDFSITCHIRSSRSTFASWLSSIVCAGVLVICLVVELAFRHAPSLTSSLNLVEVETLPSK